MEKARTFAIRKILVTIIESSYISFISYHVVPCGIMLNTKFKDLFLKNIVIWNRKIGRSAVIFTWTWNIWVGCIENTSKQWKMVALWGIAQWKWLWGCFSYFLLLWLWCQRFWGNSENRYRSKRFSHMLLL